MAQITQKELSQQLDIHQIIDEARKRWERGERRRQSVTQWITRALPPSLVAVFIVFYLLSAPHTVNVVNYITPQWGWLAPIGFEILIFIVAAFREKGWRGTLTFTILWTLVTASIIINVSGGLLVIIEHGSKTLSQLTPRDLMAQLGTLPVSLQIPILMAFIIGPLIPIIGKFAGEALIKIATGKIKLEHSDMSMRWYEERWHVGRSALFGAALQFGAGAATAGNWADKVVEQLYGNERIVARAQPVSQSREIGFATVTNLSRLSQQNFESSKMNLSEPTQTVNDINDGHGRDLTRQQVRDWLNDNPQWVDMRPVDISLAITGHTKGLRTVYRVIAELNK